MSQLVEKVARAIEKEFGSKYVNLHNSEQFFKNVAKVAIEAMREPTEEIENVKK